MANIVLLSTPRKWLERAGLTALAPWPHALWAQQTQNRALVTTEGLTAHQVSVLAVEFKGRLAIRVELDQPAQQRVLRGGNANQAAFALLPDEFQDGCIEVDLTAEVNGRGGSDARGFVGVAFHIPADNSVYEAVYLRMTNGRLAVPTPPNPRIDRAVQYTAHPDFHFDVSRRVAPGRYEKGVDIAPGVWTSMRLDIRGKSLKVYVGGAQQPSLEIDDLRYGGQRGKIGLWVDDGTAAYFTNLRITPA
jgi:hypothetical protein